MLKHRGRLRLVDFGRERIGQALVEHGPDGHADLRARLLLIVPVQTRPR